MAGYTITMDAAFRTLFVEDILIWYSVSCIFFKDFLKHAYLNMKLKLSIPNISQKKKVSGITIKVLSKIYPVGISQESINHLHLNKQ